jgi:hypothetical protein
MFQPFSILIMTGKAYSTFEIYYFKDQLQFLIVQRLYQMI